MCQLGMSATTNSSKELEEAHEIGPDLLADYLRTLPPPHPDSAATVTAVRDSRNDKHGECLIVDCRNFVDYNNCHVKSAVNAFYSSLVRRRLLSEKASSDIVFNHLCQGLKDKSAQDVDLILYAGDENYSAASPTRDYLANEDSAEIANDRKCTPQLTTSSGGFLQFLSRKLKQCTRLKFRKILLLRGGFLPFRKRYPELCESSSIAAATSALTARLPLLGLVSPQQGQHHHHHYHENLNVFQQHQPPFHPHIDVSPTAAPATAIIMHPSSRQQPSGEKLCVGGPSLRDVKLEHQQLLSRAANNMMHGDARLHSPSRPLNAPIISGGGPLLKMPCSLSQPCFRSFQKLQTCCESLLASRGGDGCDGENASSGPTQILDFMFLGSQQDALDPHMLENYGITKVINLSENCPRPEKLPDDEDHFLRIPIKDSYCAKLLPHFDKAHNFIEQARQSDEKVLLHCLAGISRSATLAIAYVMRSQRMASDEAYKFVKSKRPSISPNFNFMGQLMEYERQLRERHLLPPTSNRPYSFTCSNMFEPANESSAICVANSASRSTALSKSATVHSIPAGSSVADEVIASRPLPKAPASPPAVPERPSQLLKRSDSALPSLKSVREEVPSPSTEFSKLDISLSNPCFSLGDLLAAGDAPTMRYLRVANDSASRPVEPPTPTSSNVENPLFAMLARKATTTTDDSDRPVTTSESRKPAGGDDKGAGDNGSHKMRFFRSMLKRSSKSTSSLSSISTTTTAATTTATSTTNAAFAKAESAMSRGGSSPSTHCANRAALLANPLTTLSGGRRKLRCRLNLTGRCMASSKLFHHQHRPVGIPSSTFFTPVLPTVPDEQAASNADQGDRIESGDEQKGDVVEEYFSATDEDECYVGGVTGERRSPKRRLDKRQLEHHDGEEEGKTTREIDDESPESGYADNLGYHRRKYPRQHNLHSSTSTSSTQNSIPSPSTDTNSPSLDATSVCRDDADRLSVASSSSSLAEIAVK